MTTTEPFAGDLAKVRIDLEDATEQLSAYWTTDNDVSALGHVNGGVEALLRAVSTLTHVVERLVEPKS